MELNYILVLLSLGFLHKISSDEGSNILNSSFTDFVEENEREKRASQSQRGRGRGRSSAAGRQRRQTGQSQGQGQGQAPGQSSTVPSGETGWRNVRIYTSPGWRDVDVTIRRAQPNTSQQPQSFVPQTNTSQQPMSFVPNPPVIPSRTGNDGWNPVPVYTMPNWVDVPIRIRPRSHDIHTHSSSLQGSQSPMTTTTASAEIAPFHFQTMHQSSPSAQWQQGESSSTGTRLNSQTQQQLQTQREPTEWMDYFAPSPIGPSTSHPSTSPIESASTSPLRSSIHEQSSGPGEGIYQGKINWLGLSLHPLEGTYSTHQPQSLFHDPSSSHVPTDLTLTFSPLSGTSAPPSPAAAAGPSSQRRSISKSRSRSRSQ